MKKIIKASLLFLVLISLSTLVFGRTSAQSCPDTDYDCRINQIQKEIDALTPAHENNKTELANTQKQLSGIKERIKYLAGELEELEIKIAKREDDLAYAQKIFEEKTGSHYQFIRTYDPIMPFLSTDTASEAFLEIALRTRAAEGDRATMEEYAASLIALKNDKEELQKTTDQLAAVQKQVDGKVAFLAGEVSKVESYLTELSGKQQELIALKEAGFQTSIGDTPATLEPCSGPPGSSNFCDPGFRPAFAAFSFGAPHRTGMSQYGALGRSKSGQSAETILSAYYQGASLDKNYPAGATIGVDGYGRVSLEDNYLLGIYEVPEKWGDEGGLEALKAQAVAARSYALYVTDNGAGSICTSESCQVYKPQLKSGKWADAVRATRGWVLVKDGKPANAYYASTSGGYTISQWGWSGIKDASGDWPSTAYEKTGGSPWFYKGWYKSRGGNSCGRSNPWLTSREMADILNAWSVVYKGGGDVSRVSPVDTGCWNGNPYSIDELAGIGGFTSVSSVSVVYANDGYTKTVTFGTNKGSVSIDGGELKKAFNLRAPGYIGIKSSLFNIEKL